MRPCNAQGSVRALSSGSATLSDQYSYMAFGETRSQTGSSPQPYGYTGQQRDAATGLYYLRARYYAPGVGRFLSRDSVAGSRQEPATLHRYGYVHANPINLYDPSGTTAIAGGYAQTTKHISLASVSTATAVGLSVACTYRLATSYLTTALEIALFGGTYQFAEVQPCEVQRKPETCESKYPNLVKCSAIAAKYPIEGGVEDALEIARVLVVNPTADVFKPKDSTEGPCVGKGGTHWEMREYNGKGKYYTSIGVCPCCDDSSGKPVRKERCGFFGDHDPIFKSFQR